MRRLFPFVAVVVLVEAMFLAAVAPLLPHYTDELGLSKTAAGVLSAAYAAGTLTGSLPAGWLSARWGVKPTLMLGLALLGTTSIVFAFANTIELLDAARFVQGIGGACMWAAGLAWLVSAAPLDKRGALIGAVLGAAILGVLLGPVLGGAASVLGDELVFSSVAVLAAVLALWAWAMPGVAPTTDPVMSAIGPVLARSDFLAGFWLFSLPAVIAGSLEVLVPLRLDQLGASAAVVAAAFLVSAAFEATISPAAGRMSDRRGRLAPIRLGLAAAVLMLALLPLADTVLLLAAGLVATIAALGTFWAPAMALLSDASQRSGLDQALAFSIGNFAWALGHVVGGGAGGALADATSDALVYMLLGVTCAVTLFGVVALGRRSPAESTAAP